jgi:hypothetical protein
MQGEPRHGSHPLRVARWWVCYFARPARPGRAVDQATWNYFRLLALTPTKCVKSATWRSYRQPRAREIEIQYQIFDSLNIPALCRRLSSHHGGLTLPAATLYVQNATVTSSQESGRVGAGLFEAALQAVSARYLSIGINVTAHPPLDDAVTLVSERTLSHFPNQPGTFSLRRRTTPGRTRHQSHPWKVFVVN